MKELRRVYMPAPLKSDLTEKVQVVRSKAAIEPSLRFRRMSRFLEIAPVSFLTLDRRTRILELNETAAGLLSFSESWLLNRPFLVFIAKHDMTRFIAHLRDAARRRGAQKFEADLVIGNRTVPVQISLKARRDDPVVYDMAIVDLSDVKKAEVLLQESLSHWHSLVYNAPDVIVTLRKNGKIVFANSGLWGYSANALPGTRLFDYVPEKERQKLRRCLASAFTKGERGQCEIAIGPEEKRSWFLVSFGPAKQSKGAGQSTALIRDISTQKESELLLRNSSEQMRDFAARIDAVREEERTRLARELHDELGQALTILKLDLAWVEGKLQKEHVRKKVKSILTHVDETIERVRKISSELRPAILDDLGLAAAIEWLASQIQTHSRIRTQLNCAGEIDALPKQAAVAVFRVVQEALTNVVRHSEASRVRISLKSENRFLKITVEDNGKGMPKNVISEAKSLGIIGMRERISRVGGNLNLVSEAGKGTRLEITIPISHD